MHGVRRHQWGCGHRRVASEPPFLTPRAHTNTHFPGGPSEVRRPGLDRAALAGFPDPTERLDLEWARRART